MTAAPRWITPVAAIAAIFGLATIASGGLALFGASGARAAAGDAVPFVLWFNFLAGFAYVAGAAAIYARSPVATPVAWVIGLATLAVYGVFAVAVLRGTPFEMRTVGAMALRAGFWIAVAVALTRAGRA